MNTRSFSGTHEAKTVVVTLNGRQRLADLQIMDGMLRTGPETVAQRFNETICNAQATAAAAAEADQQQFVEI